MYLFIFSLVYFSSFSYSAINLDVLKGFPSLFGERANMITHGRDMNDVILCFVNTLNDDSNGNQVNGSPNRYEGSLRYCTTQLNQPRIIIPRVSGYIRMSSSLDIRNSNFYLAGQAAPYPGLKLLDKTLLLQNADNFVIRHITVRRGTVPGRLGADDTAFVGRCNDFAFDHVSFSWGMDEIFTIWQGSSGEEGQKGGVVQRCHMAEGLDGHNTGSLCGDTNSRGADKPAPFQHEWHLNQWSSVTHRVPNLATGPDEGSFVKVKNNVASNQHGRLTNALSESRVDHFGNYYIPGNSNRNLFPSNVNVWQSSNEANDKPSIFTEGNVIHGGQFTVDRDNWLLWVNFYDRSKRVPIEHRRLTPLAVNPQGGYNARSAAQAYESVFLNQEVGHNRGTKEDGEPVRGLDVIDAGIMQRILDDDTPPKLGEMTVERWQARLPAFQKLHDPYTDNDMDGMADAWELTHGLDPNNGEDYKNVKLNWQFGTLVVTNQAGYWNLEMYLAYTGGDFDELVEYQAVQGVTQPPTTLAPSPPTAPPQPTPSPTVAPQWTLLLSLSDILPANLPAPWQRIADQNSFSSDKQSITSLPGTADVSGELDPPFEIEINLPSRPDSSTRNVVMFVRMRSPVGDPDNDASYAGLSTGPSIDRVFPDFENPGVFQWIQVEEGYNSGDVVHTGGVETATKIVLNHGDSGAVLDAVYLSTDLASLPPANGVLPSPTAAAPTAPSLTAAAPTAPPSCVAGTVSCSCLPDSSCSTSGTICSGGFCLVEQCFGQLGCPCRNEEPRCDSQQAQCNGNQQCVPAADQPCIEGQAGCPCSAQQLCVDGLVCSTQTSLCQQQQCEPGSKGCSCSASGRCFDALDCIGGSCVDLSLQHQGTKAPVGDELPMTLIIIICVVTVLILVAVIIVCLVISRRNSSKSAPVAMNNYPRSSGGSQSSSVFVNRSRSSSRSRPQSRSQSRGHSRRSSRQVGGSPSMPVSKALTYTTLPPESNTQYSSMATTYLAKPSPQYQ